MLEAIVFYLFGALVCAMFFIAVRSANVLYALSALACGMVGLSAFFFLMNAEFLGVVQIIVYSGAVVALYAFGMMFFNLSKNLKESKSVLAVILSLALVVLLSALVGCLVFGNTLPLENMPENVFESVRGASSQEAQSGLSNIQIFGYLVFTKYLIAFEVAAVLLLVAMVIGIVLIVKEGKKPSNTESARVDSKNPNQCDRNKDSYQQNEVSLEKNAEYGSEHTQFISVKAVLKGIDAQKEER